MLAEEVDAFNLRHASKSTGMDNTNSSNTRSKNGGGGGGGGGDGGHEKAGGVMVHAVLQPFMVHVPVTDNVVEHFDCT